MAHTQNKPSVLYITLEGRMAGAEHSLLSLVQGIRHTYDVTVACPYDGTLVQRLDPLNINHVSLPPAPHGPCHRLHRLHYPAALQRCLGQRIDALRPSLIHANSTTAALAVRTRQRPRPYRLIGHVRDMPRLGFQSRRLAQHCDRLICVSRTIQNRLQQQGVSQEKLTVIYNGVSFSIVSSPAASPPRPHLRFANIGQFVPWKRPHLFLAAASRFAEQSDAGEFWVIGNDRFDRDRRYRRRLEKQRAAFPQPSRLQWLGWQEDMTLIWPQIDCLVHTADREPFGRVIVEAMARGIPVIAAQSGRPAEIIRPRETGLLITSTHPQAWADAMCEIAANPGLAQRLSQAGVCAAATHFTENQMIQQTLDLYRQLLP